MEGLLRYRASGSFEFRGPVNVETSTAFETIAGGATPVTARIYNTANDVKTVDLVARLSAAAAAAATDLSVGTNEGRGYGVGDSVHVKLASGLIHPDTIDAGGTDDIVKLVTGLPTAALEGAEIRRVTMATTGKYFSVDSLKEWKIGLTLITVFDDFGGQQVTVDQVLNNGNCLLIRVNTAPNSAISSGAELKNPVGPSITGVDFGTPTTIVGDKTWGFRYPVAEDHDGIELEQHLRAEMLATSSGGLVAREEAFATVVGDA